MSLIPTFSIQLSRKGNRAVDLTQNVWLKTGSLVSILSLIAGLGSVLTGLPQPYAGYLAIAVAVAGAVLKVVNPADSKIEG